MFGFFKKKQGEPPKALYFKSNQDAFAYACKYCTTTLELISKLISRDCSSILHAC
jgi:hypothetical protein